LHEGGHWASGDRGRACKLAQDDPANRLNRARVALEGLSVGDAFGERWFYIPSELIPGLISSRAEPAPIWDYTDDTQMALSVFHMLRRSQSIDQEGLALSFANYYSPSRKYGASMRGLFLHIADGVPWREAARSLFGGQGSFGNGAAMRVAPLGAYFADDLEKVVEQAQRSAEVTHAHPEGIAGAIAVAVAAALACQLHDERKRPERREFLQLILPFVPQSEMQSKLHRALEIPQNWTSIAGVVALLGNGSKISAQDTVPFCLWCVAEHLDNYQEALWLAASAYGDVDTNCAIVGGIVASYTGVAGIPEKWLAAREPLPSWPFAD